MGPGSHSDSCAALVMDSRYTRSNWSGFSGVKQIRPPEIESTCPVVRCLEVDAASPVRTTTTVRIAAHRDTIAVRASRPTPPSMRQTPMQRNGDLRVDDLAKSAAIDVDMVRRVESLLIRPLLKTSVTPRNA